MSLKLVADSWETTRARILAIDILAKSIYTTRSVIQGGFPASDVLIFSRRYIPVTGFS